MGRKIPGRKHHGVRDVEKQQEERFNKLKNKINAPPSNPDDQHIPKSLTRIRELINKSKSGFYSKKKSKVVTKERKHEAPLFDIKQGPSEPRKAFLWRVTKACEEIKKEAAFENKYKVNVKRNSETGEVQGVEKRSKDPLELMVKQVKKERKDKKTNKKSKNNEEKQPRLTKSQKRSLKLKEKKERTKLKNADEFKEYQKEHIKFGDIVHAPPSLTVPRRVKTPNSAPRPGQKDMLLKNLIAPKNKQPSEKSKTAVTVDKVKKILHKTIDKKGKRKDLPNALRRQLDNQQKDIIQAYKELKAKKFKS